MSEVIFALTKRSPKFWVRLDAKIGGGGGKISHRSWLSDIKCQFLLRACLISALLLCGKKSVLRTRRMLP